MEEFLTAQLLLSEPEFLAEVSANTAAMAIDTATEKILYATGEAERLFKCKVKNGLNGTLFEQLIPESLRARHRQYFQRYLADPHPRPMGGNGMTLEAQDSDGGIFPVAIGLHPLKKIDRLYVILTMLPLPDGVR